MQVEEEAVLETGSRHLGDSPVNIRFSQSQWKGQALDESRRMEAPRRSYVEAFATATCALNVGIIKNKFTGKLRLHKVHLSSQKGELSLLLYEDPHTCKCVTVQPSVHGCYDVQPCYNQLSVFSHKTLCKHETTTTSRILVGVSNSMCSKSLLFFLTYHPAAPPHQICLSPWCSPECRSAHCSHVFSLPLLNQSKKKKKKGACTLGLFCYNVQ